VNVVLAAVENEGTGWGAAAILVFFAMLLFGPRK
jgi:hypothetical protein